MPPTYFYVVLRRSLGFWIGLRLLLLVVVLGIVSGGGASAIDVTGALASPGTSMSMIPATVGLLLFDARTAGEDLLLANFGYSRTQVALRAVILPAIGEALVLLTMAGR
ncbi:MAG: hypothetical protein WEE89_06760 [Gemmatimonadota bacterium]